jgi:hypothetical protein
MDYAGASSAERERCHRFVYDVEDKPTGCPSHQLPPAGAATTPGGTGLGEYVRSEPWRLDGVNGLRDLGRLVEGDQMVPATDDPTISAYGYPETANERLTTHASVERPSELCQGITGRLLSVAEALTPTPSSLNCRTARGSGRSAL